MLHTHTHTHTRKRGGGLKEVAMQEKPCVVSSWDEFHWVPSKPYSLRCWRRTVSHITDLTTGHSGLLVCAGFSFSYKGFLISWQKSVNKFGKV